MRPFILTLVVFASFFVRSDAFAAASNSTQDPTCVEYPTPLPQQKGGLCLHPGEENADVLYYLHGKDGDAQIWGLEGFWSQQIRDWWKAKGHPAPTVVSISLGAAWLLGPKNNAPAGFGLLEHFLAKVMPDIEARLGGVKGRRLLLGDSMGGFNAIQLGMKTDLFDKVAALCAPIGNDISPFASDEELAAYVRKSSAFRSGKHGSEGFDLLFGSLKLVQMVAGFFWTDAEEFKASDPLLMARALRSPRSAQWYLAAGFFDHYVTYEGNEAFASALAASGTSVDWRPQWGGHCAVDVPSLADFLVR